MDIAALSASMSQVKVAQQVSLSVAKLSMDATKVQTDEMVKALEKSVTPHLGSNIDLKL